MFQQKIVQPSVTVKLALSVSNDTFNALNSVSGQFSNQRNGAISNQTSASSATNPTLLDNLPEDCTLIFCDVSYDKDTNIFGIGIYMTTGAGNFKG